MKTSKPKNQVNLNININAPEKCFPDFFFKLKSQLNDFYHGAEGILNDEEALRSPKKMNARLNRFLNGDPLSIFKDGQDLEGMGNNLYLLNTGNLLPLTLQGIEAGMKENFKQNHPKMSEQEQETLINACKQELEKSYNSSLKKFDLEGTIKQFEEYKQGLASLEKINKANQELIVGKQVLNLISDIKDSGKHIDVKALKRALKNDEIGVFFEPEIDKPLSYKKHNNEKGFGTKVKEFFTGKEEIYLNSKALASLDKESKEMIKKALKEVKHHGKDDHHEHKKDHKHGAKVKSAKSHKGHGHG